MEAITREIGMEVEIEKMVTVKEIGIKEEIVNVNHHLADRILEVITKVYNSKDELIKNNRLIIEGEQYRSIIDNDQLVLDSTEVWNIIDSKK